VGTGGRGVRSERPEVAERSALRAILPPRVPDRPSPHAKVGSEIRRRHLEHVALVVENERADFKPGQRGHADGKGRDQNQSQERSR
jgi:hypothetical protein